MLSNQNVLKFNYSKLFKLENIKTYYISKNFSNFPRAPESIKHLPIIKISALHGYRYKTETCYSKKILKEIN